MRADRRARERRAVLRRRRVPVHLSLPPRRRRGLPRAARSLGRRARAHPELPLPARGARSHQPPLQDRLRRFVQPLSAAGRFADPAFGPAVELLVTDKGAYKDSGTHWRKAEARHVAARVKDIVDSGEAAPGEIVLLFAAGTDARIYEEELRAAGLRPSGRPVATTTTSSRSSTSSLSPAAAQPL